MLLFINHRVCETVESHLWLVVNSLLPAYRGIRTLRSSRSPPRCSTVKVADGTTLTGESEIWRPDGLATLTSCIVWTPPGREFPWDVDAVPDADPSVSCDPPT